MQFFYNTPRYLHIFFVGAAMMLATSMAPAQPAQSQSHVFNLYIKGFKAGTIATAAKKTKTAYALSGKVAPTAFLRLLRDIGYTGSASGSFSGVKYRPRKYAAHIKTGSDTSTVKMRYIKGKPVVDAYAPGRAPRDYDIKPSAQRGTVDLLTALHMVFENTSAGALCNRIIPMFDGRRRSKLTLSKPKKSGKGATCSGKYTRVAGFSPHDMQKKVNFPFTLVYDRLDDGNYRLMSFHTETTFGRAKAVRK